MNNINSTSGLTMDQVAQVKVEKKRGPQRPVFMKKEEVKKDETTKIEKVEEVVEQMKAAQLTDVKQENVSVINNEVSVSAPVVANATTPADDALTALEMNSKELFTKLKDLKKRITDIREDIRSSINAASSKDTHTSNLEERKNACNKFENDLKETAKQWKDLSPKSQTMIKTIDSTLADLREFNLQPDYKQKIEKIGLKVLLNILENFDTFHARRVDLDSIGRNISGTKQSIDDLIVKADSDLDTLRSYAGLSKKNWFFSKYMGQSSLLQEETAPVGAVEEKK